MFRGLDVRQKRAGVPAPGKDWGFCPARSQQFGEWFPSTGLILFGGNILELWRRQIREVMREDYQKVEKNKVVDPGTRENIMPIIRM